MRDLQTTSTAIPFLSLLSSEVFRLTRQLTFITILVAPLSPLVSGCGSEKNEGGNSVLKRDDYQIVVHLTFDNRLFRSSYPGEPHFFPFDEGHLRILAITSPVPTEWAFSRAQVQATPVEGQSTHGPYLVHPEVRITVMRRAPLPAFICAEVQSLPEHLVVPNAIRPAAITSCKPIPPEFETEGFTAKEHLPDDHVIREPVELEFSTLVPASLAGTGLGGSWFENIDAYVKPDDLRPAY